MVVARPRVGFGACLVGIALLGVIARVLYIELVAPHAPLFADSLCYYQEAINLRHGLGYINIGIQFGAFTGHAAYAGNKATAYWPPAYSGYLVVVQQLFGESMLTSQLAGAVTGGATVALTGLLGRAIAGRAVGLVAAALVAVSPFVIALDGSLMSETLYLPLVVLALLLAQHAREHPTAPRWCALGAVIGLATLTRQDALLLVVVAVIPAAILPRDAVRHLVPRVALGLGVMALVLAPWVVRNAVRVGDPTLSTGSAATALAGANCDATYHGGPLSRTSTFASWDWDCADPELGFRISEASWASKIRARGIHYALDHPADWPGVVTARVARTYGIWNPDNLTRLDAAESRNRHWQWPAWGASLVVLTFGVVGIVLLARRRRPIAMLVAPLMMSTALAVFTYGNTRFRAPAEIALTIGAAATIVAVVRGMGARRASVIG